MKLTSKTFAIVSAAVLGLAHFAGSAVAADKFPPLAPLGDPPVPADNPMTPAKVELGKKLFFDPRLGGDASISCGSCHEPEQGWAFSDGFSRGYPGTVHWRNSQTVINAAYYGKLFWAGSSKSLERQAKSAASGAVAGNGEADMMEARLAFIPEYRKAFKEIFGSEWPKIGDAWMAIAAYERTLVQKDTPLDNYLRGDKNTLTAEQKNGMNLFTGKAGCIQCHNGAMATDEKYYNLGVPAPARWDEDGLAQVTFRYELYAKGMTQDKYRRIKDDPGFYFRTKEKSDMGKFRTPSLRYAKYTAPYMHNGVFWDLREVVEFYNAGGGENIFTDGTEASNKTKVLKPLGLTDKEVDDLVAFVEAFSGPEIKVEKPKLPDYAPLPN